jgi:hypothetical protein
MKVQSDKSPNKVTGTNAGGPRQLQMRTRWAARVAQFWRYRAEQSSAFLAGCKSLPGKG